MPMHSNHKQMLLKCLQTALWTVEIIPHWRWQWNGQVQRNKNLRVCFLVEIVWKKVLIYFRRCDRRRSINFCVAKCCAASACWLHWRIRAKNYRSKTSRTLLRRTGSYATSRRSKVQLSSKNIKTFTGFQGAATFNSDDIDGCCCYEHHYNFKSQNKLVLIRIIFIFVIDIENLFL